MLDRPNLRQSSHAKKLGKGNARRTRITDKRRTNDVERTNWTRACHQSDAMLWASHWQQNTKQGTQQHSYCRDGAV